MHVWFCQTARAAVRRCFTCFAGCFVMIYKLIVICHEGFVDDRFAQLAVTVLHSFLSVSCLSFKKSGEIVQASGTNTLSSVVLFLLQRLSQYCCEDLLDVEWNSGQALIATLLRSWVRHASFPWRTTQSVTEHEGTGHSGLCFFFLLHFLHGVDLTKGN